MKRPVRANILKADSLFPASNRRLFARGIDNARKLGNPLAVLFIDLDRFRLINDVLGHDAGNLVLRDVAARVAGCVRDGDVVARIAGDEFAVLLEGVESPSLATAIADRVRAEVSRPFLIAKREVCVSASIGIALYPRDGLTAEELLLRADLAMSQAKELGGDRHQFHAPGSEDRISTRLEMEASLRRALEHGELEVYYQPQARLADGTIHSVEALLRWNSADLGLVMPAQFMPLAEETGLIHSIGAWVIETAAAQARAWQTAGLPPLRMCINVSARQLNERLVDTVSRVLAETGLAPSCFELEITESVMVPKNAETDAALTALRALGIEFAIDDFGTGYATFDYLRRFPVRTMKLDGSFVRGICNGADDTAIVAASVSLARSLGLRIVAEGVETPEQHERLRTLGCDDCQGYYVCRPLPAAGLEKFLEPVSRAPRTDRPRLSIAR